MRMMMLMLVIALTGCQSGNNGSQWNDMWTDIALRHRYEKYGCAHCPRSLEGYSKDSGWKRKPIRLAGTAPVSPEPVSVHRESPAQESYNTMEALETKIAVLEDVLKKNAETTNQNQQTLVDQINRLKAELNEIHAKPVPATSVGAGLHLPE